MEGEVEDGELSGSDSEMGASSGAPPRPPAPPPSYRGGGGLRAAESSDSDPDSSGDEAALWRGKRQKVSGAPQPPGPPGHAPPGAPQARRVNNIWGSVVQEQCQDSLTAELGFFGMEGVGTSSRSVETYNFVLARKLMEKERELERQQRGGGEASMLDAELDDYMKGRGSEDGGGGGDAKRKRAAKQRLGPRRQVTEDDEEERVAEEIARRLQEPKRELIRRVVRVLGRGRALQLLGETTALEDGGGVLTADGSRRRTPGGVYLHLLKGAAGVGREHLRRIFLEEQREESRSRRAAQRRRRHAVAREMKQAVGMLNLQEHDDGSRETFAGDANEALEALEEAQEEEQEEEEEEEEEQEEEEEEQEQEQEQEAAVGTEENAVVYNAADLEVF